LDKKVIRTFKDFTLPKVSIPTLKRLDFRFKGEGNRGLEEFLEINPNIESLLTRSYILNISSSLNSLKSIDSDGFITLDNIDKDFRLDSINNLAFLISSFDDFGNIKRFCKICPNINNLNIDFLKIHFNFQTTVDMYLVPSLSYIYSLKTIVLINVYIYMKSEIIDFSKFSQIEKLKVQLKKGSILNLKFENCKNLKRVEFKSYDDEFTDEFKRKFDHYYYWKFNFGGNVVKGNKI
jgi:hypothetical protein